MKFTLLGGDERMVRLCRLLEKDGHSVAPFALEKALPCPAAPDFDCDCIILPLPCTKDGVLFAPNSERTWGLSELLMGAKPGTKVLAGKAPRELKEKCGELLLPLTDYFLREDFTLRNALLTAEGAVSLMLRESEKALLGSRVLIFGFGRIARALAQRLTAFGAHVTVAARDPAARVLARSMGCAGLDFSARPRADFVVNTVPAQHVSANHFPGAKCIELASPPYGFELEELGRAVILGSALPGKTAPESAAEAIRDTVYGICGVR